MHSFRSLIEATEKLKQYSGNLPGGGGIWTAFRPGEGGIWTKIFQKFKCPGGCPGGMLKLRFYWYIRNRKTPKNFVQNRNKSPHWQSFGRLQYPVLFLLLNFCLSNFVLLSEFEVLSLYSLVNAEFIVVWKFASYFCKSAPQTYSNVKLEKNCTMKWLKVIFV